jgi:hypothetical protein
VKIIKIILRILPEVKLPKRVGAPYTYSSQVIMCCFVVMAAKRLSVRGLHAFLTSKEDCQAAVVRELIPFPQGQVPDRRTFDRRLTNWQLSAQLYMLAATGFLVKKFRLGIARLSVDNRMFPAFGGIWHKKDQNKGIIPKGLRNIDVTAGWGVSAYRGWVFGHGLDVFVTTGRLVLPILASARSLKIRGNTALKQVANLLPKVKKGVVSADCEYHDRVLDRYLRKTGRSLHAPTKYEPSRTPKSKTYRRRKVTVEPFYERFLLAFVGRSKLDRKGPQAWPFLVTCCFLYQLMVIYNLMQGKPEPLHVTHLIRML